MADGSSNAFLEIVRTAAAQDWCMKPYCMTCGAMDYRSALRKLGGELGGPLADALAAIDLDELTSLPRWRGALEIAIGDLPLQATALLASWLEHADQNVRFLDFVLFKLVRHLPAANSLRSRWESKALTVLEQTRDFSLTESLILTLQDRALAHHHLMALAKSFAATSPQMRRVLRNACNVEIDAGC